MLLIYYATALSRCSKSYTIRLDSYRIISVLWAQAVASIIYADIYICNIQRQIWQYIPPKLFFTVVRDSGRLLCFGRVIFIQPYGTVRDT